MMTPEGKLMLNKTIRPCEKKSKRSEQIMIVMRGMFGSGIGDDFMPFYMRCPILQVEFFSMQQS